MDTIDKLAEIFKEFPGIGQRQARRFVYYLMARDSGFTDNLTNLLSALKKEVAQCKECFRFFLSRNGDTCDICADPNLQHATLMVLEKDSDLESVRKSGVYQGKFFVLGGLVPIVEKNTKRQIRIEELKKKIMKDKPDEIILAFSMSPHGEHTDQYVRNELKNLTAKISSLGRGLSTGTELEYSDNDTLRNALKNRS